MTESSNLPTLPEQLSQLFGSYKAEWLKEQIFELYTEPAYFPELTTSRSCILIGGRGTGKTTVLRGLSYEGQFVLSGRQVSSIPEWSYFGLYYRVDTNHVTAFVGPELQQNEWIPLFGHYFNMLVCDWILQFLDWYELHTGSLVELGNQACQRISQSLHLKPTSTHREIREQLTDAKIAFEAYINNVVDAQRPRLSLQAAPINLLCKTILSLARFRGRQFFFLIDEYENLLDYQQQIINTLIKHASDLYSFKVGVRELGWRCHSTLNPNEQLVHPADYARIDISEKLQGEVFEKFALDVCVGRLSRLQAPDQEIIRDVRVALPSLSEDEEAKKLGVENQANSVRQELISQVGPEQRAVLDTLRPLELYFLRFWSQAQNKTLSGVFSESLSDSAGWKTRYDNYKHALLYTLRRGKRGIRKYYAGWDVFTQLGAGNIRYVLELVDQSYLAHFHDAGTLDHPISHDVQTRTAEQVGGMNIAELEGVSVDGARLTKLLLALGRVFQVMASAPEGHAPEINQFQLAVDEGRELEGSLAAPVERLLNSAVMHLALVRRPGNKLGDVGDIKDYDYMIHPIFSPFFVFSYRRKRKMILRPEIIMGLIQHPKKTIRSLLSEHNRIVENEELPEQLMLFEKFYDGGS